jgi:nickel transport protein
MLLVAVAVCCARPAELPAHGARLEFHRASAITLVARYDTGMPMAGAQLTVYAPDHPTVPWLTGTCDAEGRFSFVPDPQQVGSWSVQARLAGHGAMLHLPLGAADVARPEVMVPGYSGAQRLLMAGSVLWGCIGTALYFKRRTGA